MLDEAEFEILMAKLDAHTNPGEFAKIDTAIAAGVSR
jgi:hypothetical protein